MPLPKIEFLTSDDLQKIHNASIKILKDVGVVVHHETVIERLAENGALVDRASKLVRFPESMVMTALEKAEKKFVFFGRDHAKTARFGYGDMNLISSPGQFAWFDMQSGKRRDPLLADARKAILVGDALENITIVGAMTIPVDVPPPIRDVVLTAELIKGTGKPTRCWPVSRRSSRYVLELYMAIAGGREALRKKPMVDVFFEPISPLQLPETGLEIMLEFLEYGQPVSIGPMVMASGTGPATLAGTVAQENAEILSSIVTIQTLQPGTPILYGGIPHIMDPRTSICVFGSPEQGLMAIASAQLAKFYGFPAYVNVNLTDSKLLDVQAGMEKMGSFILGALAGADLFGHAGLVGTDHGASLPWLVVDDEAMSYTQRVFRGFDVNEETLAASAIAAVGPGGNYLSIDHTIAHFRKEFFIPSNRWTRQTFDVWEERGCRSMAERAKTRVTEILDIHEPEPLEEALIKEIDRIVEAARAELVT
ncbi:MAG: trimethylamine methyltransferase family protein [Anaerolineales bacterium]|nr:trimethylamine methyltransferase family protein [Anaerolineales bacterium]